MTKQTIKRVIDYIAFIAVLVAAMLVLIGKLIPSVTDLFLLIAGIVCFLVCVLAGGYYAISRRNGVYISLLVLAAIIGGIAIFVL